MVREIQIDEAGREVGSSDSEEWVTIYPTSVPDEATTCGGQRVELPPPPNPPISERIAVWCDKQLAQLCGLLLRNLGHDLSLIE